MRTMMLAPEALGIAIAPGIAPDFAAHHGGSGHDRTVTLDVAGTIQHVLTGRTREYTGSPDLT